MKKGQNILRLFVLEKVGEQQTETPAAVSREKSFKLNFQNDFEDSTTKDTPNGEKDEEFIRNNASISCDFLVGELADLKKFEKYYKNGEKCHIQACETAEDDDNRTIVGEPFEDFYVVFDSFDITSDDRQNASATFSAHKVAAPTA